MTWVSEVREFVADVGWPVIALAMLMGGVSCFAVRDWTGSWVLGLWAAFGAGWFIGSLRS